MAAKSSCKEVALPAAKGGNILAVKDRNLEVPGVQSQIQTIRSSYGTNETPTHTIQHSGSC
jgi:hypothetical protein